MTVIEASAVVMSATIIGFCVGYIMTLLVVSLFQIIAELPPDFSVDWLSLGLLILVAQGTVVLGTSFGMKEIAKKRIT